MVAEVAETLRNSDRVTAELRAASRVASDRTVLVTDANERLFSDSTLVQYARA